MGRVEKRLYRRRSKRRRRLRLGALILLAGAVFMLGTGRGAGFLAEHIGLPSATPLSAAFDKTPDEREVHLAEDVWYAIQTGIFSTGEAAAQKAGAYADRGAPGFVLQDDGKWRVLIACYGSAQDASAVRTRLEENQKVDTYLYEWRCPALHLRLKGMAGQLDAAQAGMTLLSSSAAVLRDTAIDLDAGQLSVQEAAGAVKDLLKQLMVWEETVQARFGKQPPALLQGMTAITGACTGRVPQVVEAEDAAAMSAALKAEAMTLYDEICQWRTSVAGT